MKAKLFVLILFASVFITGIVACSSRRTKTDIKTSEDAALMAGRIIFKEKCQKCHPDGEGGVGPPLNSIHLPKFLIKAKVRSRAFLWYTGRMPAFDKHEISKKEMKELLVFVKALEKKHHE
jgi:mono/diheme cytochrome c family protein